LAAKLLAQSKNHAEGRAAGKQQPKKQRRRYAAVRRRSKFKVKRGCFKAAEGRSCAFFKDGRVLYAGARSA
jgi:hypothetical protein